MSANSKERKGDHRLHVPSQTEAMGLGGKIPAAHGRDPLPIHKDIAGQHGGSGKGAGTSGSATPIKTIHKGKGWDGPPVTKTMTPKYHPKKKG